MSVLEGSLWIYLQYDVSEEIRLVELAQRAGVPPPVREPSFRHPAPDYVRFERPPVVTLLPELRLLSGESLSGRIKYFDYGVVSMELELPFRVDWDELVRLSSRWISAPEVDRVALGFLREHLDPLRPALVNPYRTWLDEDYYILHIRSAMNEEGREYTGAELLQEFGPQIAQIVRGEPLRLSDAEQKEALASSMSYYPSDLMVVGWVSAFVYDNTAGAAPTLQLLEYANTQLLEYRHYDDVLSQVLAGAYQLLDRRRGWLARWRLQREARRLNTLRLEIIELTERTDNAIKFLSDMFYARAYRMASSRVGVNDYRVLVEEKLKIAAELYEAMVEDFRQARAFILELMVVMILVIELAMAFRGK